MFDSSSIDSLEAHRLDRPKMQGRVEEALPLSFDAFLALLEAGQPDTFAGLSPEQ